MYCIICNDPTRSDIVPLNCCAASNNVICKRCYDSNPNMSICPHCRRNVKLQSGTRSRFVFRSPSCDNISSEMFGILTIIFSIIPFFFQIANIIICGYRYGNDDFTCLSATGLVIEIIIGAFACVNVCIRGYAPKKIKLLFGLFMGTRIVLEAAGTVTLSVIGFSHTWKAVLLYFFTAYGVYFLCLIIAALYMICYLIRRLWCCTIEQESTVMLVSNPIPVVDTLPQSYKAII